MSASRMGLTEWHCKRFQKNPSFHPESNKKIAANGPIYSKITKECETQYGIRVGKIRSIMNSLRPSNKGRLVAELTMLIERNNHTEDEIREYLQLYKPRIDVFFKEAPGYTWPLYEYALKYGPKKAVAVFEYIKPKFKGVISINCIMQNPTAFAAIIPLLHDVSYLKDDKDLIEWAFKENHKDLTAALAKSGIYKDRCSNYLALAASKGHLDTVKYLIDVCKCDVNAYLAGSGVYRQTSLDLAMQHKHKEVALLLIEKGAYVCSNKFSIWSGLLPYVQNTTQIENLVILALDPKLVDLKDIVAKSLTSPWNIDIAMTLI